MDFGIGDAVVSAFGVGNDEDEDDHKEDFGAAKENPGIGSQIMMKELKNLLVKLINLAICIGGIYYWWKLKPESLSDIGDDLYWIVQLAGICILVCLIQCILGCIGIFL